MGALGLLIRMSGRSWWQARYADGKTLGEWDTPAMSGILAVPNADTWRSTRWEDVEKRGMIALRLLCPNGQVAELVTNNPDGRFIQLKSGGFSVGEVNKNFCDAHMIGVLENDDQMVRCWSWEKTPHSFSHNIETERCNTCKLPKVECGDGRQLVNFMDDIFAMRYRGIGGLSLTVQGVRL